MEVWVVVVVIVVFFMVGGFFFVGFVGFGFGDWSYLDSLEV